MNNTDMLTDMWNNINELSLKKLKKQAKQTRLKAQIKKLKKKNKKLKRKLKAATEINK